MRADGERAVIEETIRQEPHVKAVHLAVLDGLISAVGSRGDLIEALDGVETRDEAAARLAKLLGISVEIAQHALDLRLDQISHRGLLELQARRDHIASL